MRRVSLIVCLLAAAGCATQSPEQRAAGAKELFDQTTHQFHLPAGATAGAERDRLLQQAAAGYEQLLRRYADQPVWCAMALRSLGNVRAAQGRLDDAVKLYDCVASRYPSQDWEILQAWKSAADLLAEAGRPAEARQFDQKIVNRFDRPDEPEIVRTIVRAARRRLAA